MSCLWIWLNLPFAALILQSSALLRKRVSDPEVSLNCNQTVEAVKGERLTLNCSIYIQRLKGCTGDFYFWGNKGGNICNSSFAVEACEWDHLSYVSLIISNVESEEDYSVFVSTDCGVASSSVRVQLKQNVDAPKNGTGSVLSSKEDVISHAGPAILIVFIVLVGVGVLYVVFKKKSKQEENKQRENADC